jgi:hypothetical protein
MVLASKDQEHSVAQQGKSNVDAFKHVNRSPGMYSLPVLLVEPDS